MKTKKYYTAFFLILTMSLISFKIVYFDENPLEKIYTQTDRSFYFPGETIWFKSYVVKTDNTISTKNDVVNAQLISPKGAVVKKIKLSLEQGYAYGDFEIDNDWVGGIYTLKVYTNWMRNFGEIAYFTKKITVQKVVKPNLLLQLKFEKEGYGKASKVSANFEVKDLKNESLKNKKITFEVSVKGKKIITNSITTDTLGKANPTFILPKNLQSTDVVLNVLIPYKGTTESISRSIPVVLDTIDLQFFPESGKTIANTTNTIAFKAINEFGKPVDITGSIVDENGTKINTFSSFHDGMGSFQLHPKENKKYYAKIEEPFVSTRKIELPKIDTNGTRFSIKTDSTHTKLDIFSTSKEIVYLKVSNATKTMLTKTIKNIDKDVIINTKNLPIGITKFSLLNKANEIVAERLVFINAHKKLSINISLNKTIYKTREKVTAIIKTTDENNNPIPSNLSVAIADNKLLSFADDTQDHILSSLLLSSELKGKIYKPSFYFNPKESKSYKALEYLMLTHGWRTYINMPTITLENAKYKPEQKDVYSGTVVDKEGKPVKAKLLLFDNKGNKVLVFESNTNGKFHFKSTPEKTLTLLAYTDDGEKLVILKDGSKSGFYEEKNNVEHKENTDKAKTFSRNKKPTQKVIKEKTVANVSLNTEESLLEEIVVVGYGMAKRKALTGSVSYVTKEEIGPNGNTLTQALQGRVAGVMISENHSPGTSPKLRIRGVGAISGNAEPLIVVDGVPYDSNMLSTIDPNQIDSISILKDIAATTIYGAAATNGVVIVTTKSGKSNTNWNKKKLRNRKYNNYAVENYYYKRPSKTYASRVFYMPKYNRKDALKERTDFRQTIYWNPVIQTDENGEAKFEFYNSDAITSFKITAEGIGYNGLVGRGLKTYATTKLINLDFKAPNYMALNDTIVLPVTITNESENNSNARLNIIVPKHLKLLGNNNMEVNIKAKSSVLKNIKIIPIAKYEKETIEIRLNGNDFSDVVKKQVTIISPYFPTETTISGATSQSFSFNVNNAVENSINATFSIYTDVVGDVMDGIEGLIRKPYGCFEQTSSSTYPNIMVLKYLKESGKSNPKIEQKAMGFITQGYERLISFETKEGGFEWFGHTPPHETLTAYGILEFTEMKEVYDNVDQEMIDRTVKWLLSRKDTKGGFRKSKRGYDSFASSPSDVANAYILYALSEAKITADLNLEYETAFKDAVKTNDTYKMALLALTSYNLNKLEKATILITKIKANIEKHTYKKLPVTNTITRSYGASKNIETTAFVLLALLKERANNDFLITEGIDHLVSKRKGNTFGATQATAMALKALIEYTKTQKQKTLSENEHISITINGKKSTKNLTINTNGKITIDDLSNYIKEGKQHIAIEFNNPKTTFPYSLTITWDSYLPNSSEKCALNLETIIPEQKYNVGDNVNMTINIINKKNERLGMATAIIGIPSGTTAQPWQLKELLAQHKMAYYEIFDNYIVFYWREFDASETKTIRLDLKADIAGSYKAPASNVYLYYGDEYKTWISGTILSIDN